MDKKDLENYLKTKNCRGCSNRCPLSDPMCGRSKVFIQEVTGKYEKGE